MTGWAVPVTDGWFYVYIRSGSSSAVDTQTGIICSCQIDISGNGELVMDQGKCISLMEWTRQRIIRCSITQWQQFHVKSTENIKKTNGYHLIQGRFYCSNLQSLCFVAAYKRSKKDNTSNYKEEVDDDNNNNNNRMYTKNNLKFIRFNTYFDPSLPHI